MRDTVELFYYYVVPRNIFHVQNKILWASSISSRLLAEYFTSPSRLAAGHRDLMQQSLHTGGVVANWKTLLKLDQ